MKKILLAIFIFINALSIAYAQCTVPTSVLINGPATISICQGSTFTLLGNALVDAASQNGVFTYSWRKILPTPSTVIIPPTTISIPPGTPTSIPSYSINSASMSDAGTYVLRIEDGSVGNSVCYKESSVVVNVYPKPTITGTLYVCEGSTTQLTGSGTAQPTTPWASATTLVATVSNTGMVTGISAGTSVITYMNTNGCAQTATVTVNPIPTITGDLNVCLGQTTQLTGTDMPALTTNWISSTTSVATASNTGVVTGVAVGTSTITYITNKGCIQTATVTVNSLPRFSSTLNVCEGSTTQLTASTTPATTDAWISASPNIATVDNTGLVTGISTGTSVLTYTNSVCSHTATVIVNPIPTITGPLNFCHGSTSQLTGSGIPNATTPWVSGAPAIVTINNNGLMIPPSCGSATITYTTSAGCSQTATVTVHCMPTISGRLQICSGSTTQLTGTGTPAVTDAWTSASPTVAKVDNTGLVTGLAAGTSIITYTNITGCIFTATVNVLNTSLAPSVSITANPGSTICNGTAVTFKANVVYGGTPIFEWSSSVNGTTILSTTDTYTSSNLIEGEVISVKMISSLSCASPVIASNSITVHVVSPGSAPVVSIVADKTTICSNGYTTFTATPSNGGTVPIYEWSINAVSQGPPTSSATFSTSALTSSFDVVSVRLTSNSVCASPTTATASMSITVTPGIGAGTIGTDQTICYNTIPAAITQITPPTGIVGTPTYIWEAAVTAAGPYSAIPSASGPNFTFSTSITQDVYIRRVTTDPGTPAPCNTATSNVVHITVRPQLVAGVIGSDETICSGNVPTAITQTATTTGGIGTYMYQWQLDVTGAFQDIAGATSLNYTPTALIATTRFQRVETSGTCGSVTSNIVTKTVTTQEVVTVSIDDPGQTCDGDIVLLKCQATNIGSAPIYNWYVNNNVVAIISPTSPTFNTANFEPLKAGDEVWVELQSSSTCASTSSVISNKVTIDLIPCTVSNSIYTTSNIDVLMQPYVSNSIPNVIDYTYFWSTTDNTISTGTTLSQAQSGINVFPNPTTGSFNIEMPESGVDVSYDILDLTGRSVGSGTFTSTGNDQQINVDFGAGMYQVVLKYNNVVTCVRLSKVQ